ncbi:hypothetical protein ACFYY3_00885 [Streptomyces sp. NPDC001812]|uniref:Uncharacterized protein n=1 Tax=Streptomyces cathayae TaxID=3031124 RepID=A0ABY8K9U3_9ACTN|nr:hypothetical protein [Streptomyces sp. HUAS 5]WGD43611.1 hypothetical protein PYS65_27680 [Streptomyces sp. HUAS 5]
MRQTRRTQVEKRRLPARARRDADETAALLDSFDRLSPFDAFGPFDPRDPAIVRAKRLRARRADDHGRTGRS